MDANIINETIQLLRKYCPEVQKTSNPTVMTTMHTFEITYYIFSYEECSKKIDAVIYDEEDGYYHRETIYLSELYDYNPKVQEEDEAIGLDICQLYSLLGNGSTFGDWNNTRNVENIQQLHMALKLLVSYGQNTIEPICQAHVRTIDAAYNYYIYGYNHESKICTCLEVVHFSEFFITQRKISIKSIMKNLYGIEIIGRSNYKGKPIEKIKEEFNDELY